MAVSHARWLILGSLLAFAALSLGCAVALPAAQLTATAENGGLATSQGLTQASSLAASAASLDQQATLGVSLTPNPISTIGLLKTDASASVTPGPSTTASPDARASTTPSASGTPSTSVTPGVTPSAVVSATSTVQVAAAAGSTSGDAVSQMVSAVNATRSANGRTTLTVSPTLNAEAAAYAKLMGDRNFFGHDGIDGSTPESRLKAAGYGGGFCGEALEAGRSSPQAALVDWQNSPAHAAIVYNSNAVEVGIGYYNKPGSTYTTYWVLVTGNPSSPYCPQG